MAKKLKKEEENKAATPPKKQRRLGAISYPNRYGFGVIGLVDKIYRDKESKQTVVEFKGNTGLSMDYSDQVKLMAAANSEQHAIDFFTGVQYKQDGNTGDKRQFGITCFMDLDTNEVFTAFCEENEFVLYKADYDPIKELAADMMLTLPGLKFLGGGFSLRFGQIIVDDAFFWTNTEAETEEEKTLWDISGDGLKSIITEINQTRDVLAKAAEEHKSLLILPI